MGWPELSTNPPTRKFYVPVTEQPVSNTFRENFLPKCTYQVSNQLVPAGTKSILAADKRIRGKLLGQVILERSGDILVQEGSN
eukprot:scaffold37364_cov14-Tisochrysis_lutea.AAC.1